MYKLSKYYAILTNSFCSLEFRKRNKQKGKEMKKSPLKYFIVYGNAATSNQETHEEFLLLEKAKVLNVFFISDLISETSLESQLPETRGKG